MKIIHMLTLLMLISMICGCPYKDDPGKCVRYDDNALQIGIVEPSLKIASSVDSVKFWLGDKLVCNSNYPENSYVNKFVTCEYCRLVDSKHVCTCEESTLNLPAYDTSYIKSHIIATVYTCLLGELCHSETFESLHLTAKLYNHNESNIDSIVRKVDLPSLNVSYRIYNPEDSLIVKEVYKQFENSICKQDFCLIQRKDDQLICKDSESYSKVSYNTCIGNWNWDDL